VEPFFPVQTFGHAVFLIIVAGVLIAAVWAVSRHFVLLVVGLMLAVPTLLIGLVLRFVYSRLLSGLFLVLAATFLAFTAVVVLRQALGGGMVTADTVAGAICPYLLLGVIMALVFSLIELVHPGSFLAGGRPLDPTPRAMDTTAGTLATAEREHILRICEACGWRIKGPGTAAERLGLNPSTL